MVIVLLQYILVSSYLTSTRHELERTSLPRKFDIDLRSMKYIAILQFSASESHAVVVNTYLTDIHSAIRAAICGFKIRAAEAQSQFLIGGPNSLLGRNKVSKGQNTLESCV